MDVSDERFGVDSRVLKFVAPSLPRLYVKQKAQKPESRLFLTCVIPFRTRYGDSRDPTTLIDPRVHVPAV